MIGNIIYLAGILSGGKDLRSQLKIIRRDYHQLKNKLPFHNHTFSLKYPLKFAKTPSSKTYNISSSSHLMYTYKNGG